MSNATTNYEIKNNSETVSEGNRAVVYTTDPGQVAVSCFVDWTGDKQFVRRKVFKTRKAAENCAALFFAGLRRW
jgi:hypothetical protein